MTATTYSRAEATMHSTNGRRQWQASAGRAESASQREATSRERHGLVTTRHRSPWLLGGNNHVNAPEPPLSQAGGAPIPQPWIPAFGHRARDRRTVEYECVRAGRGRRRSSSKPRTNMLAVTSPARTSLPRQDSDGERHNSNDMDGPVPIDTNSNRARHSVTRL
jgi:hypothetical protein